MEKEFAFNLGDKVWLMHNNGVVCGNIAKMFYVKNVSCVDYETISENERYYVSLNDKSIGDYEKKDLFGTKENLIKSL
ncbi:MAG: hypothetical protein J5639_02215 [Bacteroidales bacterium]|nr:hypothetical protein [Bacteroidales bacterium]